MTNKRKILLFGGSFSPPTLAHEAIIAACLDMKDFDEVWVMPSGDRADKVIAIQDEDRLKML
jgi:nicotinic acid mononucleotide adenylyltransferase